MVGAPDNNVTRVAIGDLDLMTTFNQFAVDKVITWQNDGSPWNSTWSSNNVAGLSATVSQAVLADLASVGDLATDYELKIWQNDGSP